MRGVVGGGMVSVFEERGLSDAFDSIHGSSAGACAAAYFAAKQARTGVQIYYEDINNRRFIDPLRLILGRPAMDKDFLIDTVMRNKKPLDVNKIVENPNFLYITTTNATTGEELVVGRFRDADHFFQILKATITMPVIAGSPVEVGDLKIFDGGLVQQIPLKSAIDVGATHVLVLMGRKANELQRTSRNHRWHMPSIVLGAIYGSVIADLYRKKNDGINLILDQIQSKQAPNGARIDSIVRSATSIEIGRLTTDTDILKRADCDSREAALAYLDGLSNS
jgi:predicted patatin/cPLA2 family phospholipase